MSKKIIPLAPPFIRSNEIKYVKNCLDTEWVSNYGKYIDLFEKKISLYTKSKYSVDCTSGNSALHIGLKILGVKKNDEVLVPTITFIAPINCVSYIGANPIFFDCDEYHNINIYDVISFLENSTFFSKGFTYNLKTKKRISAIIITHVWGNAANLEKLIPQLKQRNIKILEDASESLGTKYIKGSFNHKHTGTIGDVGCISFNGNKIITTGGGGIILTNNKELSKKALYLTTQAKDNLKLFIHNEVGFNYRMPNLNAALGVGQLETINKCLTKKKFINNTYKNFFDGNNNLSLMNTPKYSSNNHWMNVIVFNQNFQINLLSIIKKLEKKGIITRPVWYLNHMQKQYLKNQTYKIKNSLDAIKYSLCIPSGLNLNKQDIEFIVKSIDNIL